MMVRGENYSIVLLCFGYGKVPTESCAIVNKYKTSSHNAKTGNVS